jgi:hypothetical protein
MQTVVVSGCVTDEWAEFSEKVVESKPPAHIEQEKKKSPSNEKMKKKLGFSVGG